jgi:HEAT repeat protein
VSIRLAATQIRTRHIAWALPQLEAAWQRAATDGFDVRVALAHARIALGGIDAITGPKLADFLLRALVEADDESSAADSAAEARIALGDLMPAASLLPFLGSDDNDLFRLAARVLHETHPEALQEVLPEIFAIVRERKAGTTIGSRMRTAMAKATSRMQWVPPPLLDEVSNLLDWPFPPVRETAAYALGRIGRDIPDATIRKLLAMRSGSASVAADSALADILSLETGIEDD